MRKIFYIFVLFYILPTTGSSQFVPGFKIGGNYSTCASTYTEVAPAVQYGYTFGFHSGLTLDYFINDRLSVRGELLFSQAGTEMKKMYGDRHASTMRVSYLSFPALFKVKTFGSLFLTGGGAAGFRISKDVLDFTGYNRLDFSLAAGLGYDISRKFGIEFRYNHGVMDVGGTPALYNEKPIGGYATNSRCLQFSMEYRLATRE